MARRRPSCSFRKHLGLWHRRADGTAARRTGGGSAALAVQRRTTCGRAAATLRRSATGPRRGGQRQAQPLEPWAGGLSSPVGVGGPLEMTICGRPLVPRARSLRAPRGGRAAHLQEGNQTSILRGAHHVLATPNALLCPRRQRQDGLVLNDVFCHPGRQSLEETGDFRLACQRDLDASLERRYEASLHHGGELADADVLQQFVRQVSRHAHARILVHSLHSTE
mmetsp:Transcript_74942/g.208332  ORF Transcript_74942/g.208332 Transcript_74942/m.208332 type:complete len:223 (-) Transcript_74942:2476-3144(-)